MSSNKPKVEIRLSADGSTTLYRPDLDEHYHSVHGAIQESMHVFIQAGLQRIECQNINILEVGFGTGLNAFLTLLNKKEGQINYHAIEKYPISEQIVETINYPQQFNLQNGNGLFQALHQAPWGKEVLITNDFTLRKLEIDLLNFASEIRYHLVYFDAFAPEKQPELWTDQVFETMFKHMQTGGILTTYCAKGAVRRSMLAAGFKVERLPGPPGKRQMIRAIKES